MGRLTLGAASIAVLVSGAVPAAGGLEISVAALPPVVVRTVPESGDLAVDPSLKEITVTFSKEMRDGSWSWVMLSKESFPKITGPIRYLPGNRVCVAPVGLEPGRTYAIGINDKRFTNFKDASGTPALAYLLVFRTRP
jgi:hypothetical protein